VRRAKTTPANGRPVWSPHLPRPQQPLRDYLLYVLVEGDHHVGNVRLLLLVVMVVGFVGVGRLFEHMSALPWLEAFLATLGPRESLPPAFVTLLEIFGGFFTAQVLRHALPPLLGLGLALYFGAAYLKDLLELPNLQLAFKYLIATLFGTDYPHMTIKEGQAYVGDPETNPMLKIGGPGWVHIRIGNAAIFERMAGPSNVLGAGTHFIRRFETLREAFDLREIERARQNVKMMTKDGIPLVMNEMRVRFRLNTSARDARTESNPYPVLVGAIRRAAYKRKVNAKGLENWSEMVAGAAKSTITGWVAERHMNELIPPPRMGEAASAALPPPYRQALHERFHQKDTKRKFADMGAEIVWVSVGHLRPDPDVDPDLKPEADPTGRDKIQKQIIETWRSRQAALASDLLTDARAHARAEKERSRAMAELELVMSLTSGLREAREAGYPMSDVLTNRLIEHVTGVRLRSDEERLEHLLNLAGFLRGDPAEVSPLRTALPGDLPNPNLPRPDFEAPSLADPDLDTGPTRS
jgi:regulator of protease activity HflC (stomatin/prohibitin superfamily)